MVRVRLTRSPDARSSSSPARSSRQLGDRRKKGRGTSNQKSREAKRKQRASESQFRLALPVTKTCRHVAFDFLVVPGEGQA